MAKKQRTGNPYVSFVSFAIGTVILLVAYWIVVEHFICLLYTSTLHDTALAMPERPDRRTREVQAESVAYACLLYTSRCV